MVKNKIFTLVFFLIAGQTVYAQTISCSTNPLSTTFYVQILGNQTELSVIHHNGVEHAPLINGIVTGFTLDIAKERLGYLKKMGNSFKVTFDNLNCKFGLNTAECFSNSPSLIGKQKVKSYSFSISRESVKNNFGQFEQLQVTFDYRVESYNNPMTMTYYGNRGCIFTDIP